MKQPKLVRTAAGLALALAVLLACGAGMAQEAPEPFVIRGGITWDTTPEQLQTLEGEAAQVTLYYQGVSAYTEYAYPVTKISDFQAYPYYYFRDGQLMMIVYRFTEEFSQPYVYNHLGSLLDSKYDGCRQRGASTARIHSNTDDIFAAVHLEDSTLGPVVCESYMQWWVLPDGTDIIVHLDDRLSMFYYATDRVLPPDATGL